MAPQESIPVVANVLGTIGTVLWCVQLIPQIHHNWRKKTTEGLPGSMMFLWAACAVPFGVYAVVQNFAIAIQIQAQCFGFFALVNWGQILYYENGYSRGKSSLLASFFVLLFGGIEALLILTLRGPYSRGVSWPIVLIGVVAAVLLAAGLVPPYLEIWKRKGRVIGINWIFISIDWLGAFFSLLAVVEQNSMDVLGCVLYAIVMAMEGGIFLSHGIWLLRTTKLRRQAGEAGVDFDDMPEARRYQVAKPVQEGAREGRLSTASSEPKAEKPAGPRARREGDLEAQR